MSRSGGPCKGKEGIRHSYHTASGRSKHGEPPDRQIPSLSMVQPCRRSAHQKAAGETRPCHFSCKRLPEGTTQCGSRIVPSNTTSGGSSNGSGNGSDRCLGSFGCNNRRRSRSKCPRLFLQVSFLLFVDHGCGLLLQLGFPGFAVPSFCIYVVAYRCRALGR